MFEKFNYYGNSKEVYLSCAELIHESNQKHADIIDLWFLMVNILYFICAQFDWLNVDVRNKWIYANYIVAILALILLMNFVPFFRKNAWAPALINLVILASFGIVISNAEPYMIAFMFLIIMLVIALSYIETMLRMICIQAIWSIVFILATHINKPAYIAYQDICNTIIILGLSLVLHYRFQRTRIQQFIINNQNKQIQRELEVNSSFDSLTSLFNRGAFFAISNSAIKDNTSFMALCLMDLDGFKQINDNYGHQVGDQAIRLAGEVIADVLRMDLSDKWEYKEKVLRDNGSFAGRLGGDEYILLIRDNANAHEVKRRMEDLLCRLNHLKFEGVDGVKASVGMTQIAVGEPDIDQAYKRADDALYRSKRNGKNQIMVG